MSTELRQPNVFAVLLRATHRAVLHLVRVDTAEGEAATTAPVAAWGFKPRLLPILEDRPADCIEKISTRTS